MSGLLYVGCEGANSKHKKYGESQHLTLRQLGINCTLALTIINVELFKGTRDGISNVAIGAFTSVPKTGPVAY